MWATSPVVIPSSSGEKLPQLKKQSVGTLCSMGSVENSFFGCAEGVVRLRPAGSSPSGGTPPGGWISRPELSKGPVGSSPSGGTPTGE